MTPDNCERRISQGPDPDRIWQRVLLLKKEGAFLTDSQKRALELREASIATIEAMEEIVENPLLEEDVIKEASVTFTYWEGLLKLQDMGITSGMHAGREPEVFKDPNIMAEWIAGNLIGIEKNSITPARKAFAQVQEHSEGEIPVSESINAFMLDTKSLSPSFKNWLVMRSLFDACRRFLATDLDKSQ